MWFKIGKCHKALGNLDDARSVLIRVHQAAPDFEEVTLILVELYSATGEVLLSSTIGVHILSLGC